MIGSSHHRATALAFERGYRVDDEGRLVAPSGRVRVVSYRQKRSVGTPYGRVSLRTEEGSRSFEVHKLAAYQRFGDAAFEPGVVVRHLNGCSTDNRPANLALGSQSENMLDRSEDDRKAHALKAAAAKRKLAESDVRDLVAMRRGGARGMDVARQFGVPESTVSEIMSGKLYSELSGIPFAARKTVAA